VVRGSEFSEVVDKPRIQEEEEEAARERAGGLELGQKEKKIWQKKKGQITHPNRANPSRKATVVTEGALFSVTLAKREHLRSRGRERREKKRKKKKEKWKKKATDVKISVLAETLRRSSGGLLTLAKRWIIHIPVFVFTVVQKETG